MRSIPAIVEPAPIDVDTIADAIVIALNQERTAESKIQRLLTQLGDAQDAARQRRTEIGKLLNKARPQWPERGPRAKGWGEFLRRVGIDDSTARRYMDDSRGTNAHEGKDFAQQQSANTPESEAESEPPRSVSENPAHQSSPPTMLDHEPGEAGPVNGNGGSGDPARGTYCTPRAWALAAGEWDLDPFSNPRSHVAAAESCQLERGEDGLLDLATPGSFFSAARGEIAVATAHTRVWIQPPYEIVDDAIAHYGHTRFCALLRLDSSTAWFDRLIKITKVIALPLERLGFERPPGIETSGASPYPHALYYADERDVTDEIRRLCIVLRVEHKER